jgi:prepilin-type N-terminal cleavage/methylation domain-containing protein
MNKSIGFTLLELLICLTIFCIIAFYSNPISMPFVKKNQLLIIANEIQSAVQFSKMESILRGEHLILTCLDDNNWSSGMKLYSKSRCLKNSNQSESLIRVWQWTSTGIKVVWKGFQSNESLSFLPDINQSSVNGSFWISTESRQGIKLIVNRLGRVYSKKISILIKS